MRILMLTQWYDPEPFLKGLPFAKALTELGHEVQVVTGFPNYPGGKVYGGYKIKLFQKEVFGNVAVLRVPLYPSHDSSTIKRVLNYASFAISLSLFAPLVKKNFDVMYVYHPPASIGLAAILVSLVRKIPFVYDIQDLWPDTLKATGMFRFKKGLSLIDWWCRILYRRAKKIVVLSPGFKRELISRGVPSNKIEIVYNWAQEEFFPVSDHKNEKIINLKKKLGIEKTFNVVFAGNIGKAQALETILEAADIIRAKYTDIRFVFIGDGISLGHLKKKSEENDLPNTIFLSRKPPSEIGLYLEVADALLIHLKNDPLFKITIPSKTQSYLSVGKPILHCVGGDSAELIKEANAGIVCCPENAKDIAKKVERLYLIGTKQRLKMGENGKNYYEANLSFAKGVRKFEWQFQALSK